MLKHVCSSFARRMKTYSKMEHCQAALWQVCNEAAEHSGLAVWQGRSPLGLMSLALPIALLAACRLLSLIADNSAVAVVVLPP